MYGGKLAWGPEAIVRDDPNFQGLGNLSSGTYKVALEIAIGDIMTIMVV